MHQTHVNGTTVHLFFSCPRSCDGTACQDNVGLCIFADIYHDDDDDNSTDQRPSQRRMSCTVFASKQCRRQTGSTVIFRRSSGRPKEYKKSHGDPRPRHVSITLVCTNTSGVEVRQMKGKKGRKKKNQIKNVNSTWRSLRRK